ncbi:hypothetical protein [Rubripirellula lacrimiformis]|nr:hypothetical protein [Rubripirellula lacrimiformis]
MNFERLELRLPLTAESNLDLSYLADLLADLSDPDQQLVGETTQVDVERSGSDLQTSGAERDAEVIRLRLDAGDARWDLGDTIDVNVFVRSSASVDGIVPYANGVSGLFQAKLDLSYDPHMVEPLVEQISVHDRFWGSARLDANQAGLLRDVGGLVWQFENPASNETATNGQGEFLLATVPFRVIQPGDVSITPVVDPDSESFLAFGSDFPVPASSVRFDPLVLNIGQSRLDVPAIDLIGITSKDPIDLVPIAYLPIANSGPFARFEPSSSRLISLIHRSMDEDPDEDDRHESSEDAPLKDVGVLDDDGRKRANDGAAGLSDFDLETRSEELEDSDRFWRHYDLKMLDDEFSVSLFELSFRSLRLQSSPDSPQSNGVRDQDDASFPSVIDAGLADISVWFTSPAYRSWQPSDRPQSRDVADSAFRSRSQTWEPRGKSAELRRLETAEEVANHVDWPQAELFRRLREAILDQRTSLPAPDSTSDNSIVGFDDSHRKQSDSQ